jgi:hypothetical protein
MVLPPVGAVAPAMHRNLSQDELGGEAPLCEVRRDSLLRPLGWNFRIKKYENGRTSSAQSGTEDS